MNCLLQGRRQSCRLPKNTRHRDETFKSLSRGRSFRRVLFILNRQSFAENEKWLYDGLQHPLHFVLPHKPPLDVVDKILLFCSEAYPVPEEALDAEGRTPLHIAVEHNCAFDVVERLLSGVSLVVPAVTRDARQRCPLHSACMHPAAPGRAPNDNKFQTILLLLQAFPQAANMTDADGRTPKDYAIHRALENRVIEILKRVAQNQKAKEDGAQKENEMMCSASPRGVADIGALEAATKHSCMTVEVPSVAACTRKASWGVSRYLCKSDYFRQPSIEDDVSSLGNDRGSSAAASSPLHERPIVDLESSHNHWHTSENILSLPGAESPTTHTNKHPLSLYAGTVSENMLSYTESPTSYSNRHSLYTGTDSEYTNRYSLYYDESQGSTASFSTPSPPTVRTKSLIRGHVERMPSSGETTADSGINGWMAV